MLSAERTRTAVGTSLLPFALGRTGFRTALCPARAGCARRGRSGRPPMSQARPHPYVVERSEEHTSELQSHHDLVCRLLLEKKNQDTEPSFGRTFSASRRPLRFSSCSPCHPCW